MVDNLFKLKSTGNQKNQCYGMESNVKSHSCGIIFMISFTVSQVHWFLFMNMNMDDEKLLTLKPLGNKKEW